MTKRIKVHRLPKLFFERTAILLSTTAFQTRAVGNQFLFQVKHMGLTALLFIVQHVKLFITIRRHGLATFCVLGRKSNFVIMVGFGIEKMEKMPLLQVQVGIVLVEAKGFGKIR